MQKTGISLKVRSGLTRLSTCRPLLREPTALFILIALIFGMVFVIKTPPLWGGDETTHFARAYQIDKGHIISEHLNYPFGDKSFGGQVPQSVFDLIWHVNGDIVTDNQITSYGVKRIDNIKGYKSFADAKLNSKHTQTYFFPNTAAYSPVAYIPSLVAIKLSILLNLSVGHTIFLARFGGLLFYIACVAYALYALKGLRYAWLVMAVALMPMLIFQASIIGGDLMANALTILMVGLLAKSWLKRRLTMPDTVLLSLATILLPLVKPNYIFLSAAVLLVPAVSLPAMRFKKYLKPTLIILSCIGLLIWTYITREVPAAIRLIGVGSRYQFISVSQQTHFLEHHPLSFVKVLARTLLLQDNNLLNGMFGQLSFDFVQVPAISILASSLALLIAMGISEKFKQNIKRTAAILLLIVAGVARIFVTFYLTFSNVAEPIVEGVQGRYFLPFLLLSLTAICMYVPNLRLQLNRDNQTGLGLAIASLSTISLFFAAVKLFYVLLG